MEPEYGKLACGYEGKGRFPKTSEIIPYISTYLEYTKDLEGKTILISAGANEEIIDPMRYITNRSSGKMGIALARAAHIRGASVKLIYAAVSQDIPEYFSSSQALSAKELYNSISQCYAEYQTIIMAAAVADYTPTNPAENKIKNLKI